MRNHNVSWKCCPSFLAVVQQLLTEQHIAGTVLELVSNILVVHKAVGHKNFSTAYVILIPSAHTLHGHDMHHYKIIDKYQVLTKLYP